MAEIPKAIAPLDIFRGSVMVEGNRPPQAADALFFHGRSFGDEDGLFELAAELYREGLIKDVVLFDTEGEREGGDTPFQANRGKTAYTEDLVKLGIPQKNILYGGIGKNTKTESDGFLALAKTKGWKSVIVMTQPHQMLRAMLGLIKAMEQQNYRIYAYPVVLPFTEWQKEVHSSQGLESKPREEHIKDEFDRIARYQEKRDLASFEELVAYLHDRENCLI